MVRTVGGWRREKGVIVGGCGEMHEVWAQGRMAQGWTYGPKRDDVFKQHPCLVPYSDLPETEKEYDRKTALGTLKLIKSLAFVYQKSNH